LIACEWLTAEYVRAHVEFAQAEGKEDFAIGIAINRMLDHIDQPTRHENGHIENCGCADCTRGVGRGAYDLLLSRRGDDEEEETRTCIWQDQTDEVIESGPLKGRHRRLPFCGAAITNGSMKWCDEHLQIGIETYGD